MEATILIFGSGSLARAICYSLATLLSRPYRVVVGGRCRKQLDEILYVSNAIATGLHSPAAFEAIEFKAESDDAGELLAAVQPDVMANCASYYSPWESMREPSLWTQLLQQAGFGFTLPLQAAFPIKLARAVAGHARPVPFVNGCYPDAVNPVLRALNLPVFCGIGNIGVLAATVRSSLALPPGQRLQMLAHHVHLNHLKPGVEEARAWIDGKECKGVSGLLMPQRASHGLEVNKVIGLTAAILLREILEGRTVETHVPGPLGLPGGYPVTIGPGRIELNLPSQISASEAVAWNEKSALADGVRVLPQGDIEFGEAARRVLKNYLPEAADGFHVSEMQKVTQSMLELRDRLRRINAQAAGANASRAQAS